MPPLSFSLPVFLSTFAIIFAAELPDKTALASLVLATRYPIIQVVGGAWLAFLAQTLIGVAAGSVLQLLPDKPIRLAAGVGFLIFAYLAYRQKEEEPEEEEAEIATTTKRQRPVWLTCFLVVFAAEWGDLTQLATAAMVAQTRDALSAGLGALLALWAVALLAATVGSQMGKLLKPRLLKLVSAGLFALVGVLVIVSTLAS